MKTLVLALCLLPSVALADPLRDGYTHVAVKIDGDLARTVVTQVLVNDLDSDVEASYGFPLPADATVTGFADWRDGVRHDAHAADKNAAEKAYDEAASAGKRAALGSSDGENRFSVKLATVPAHGSRRVELSYTQTLSSLGGERTFVFPAARFEAASPPTVLDVEIAVATEQPIERASSVNHVDALVTQPDPEHVALRISRTHGGLGRDLVLRWQQHADAADLAAHAVRTAAGQPAWLAARFALNADPFASARRPLDVVLVIDTSLSMAGEPLQRAQKLAETIIGQLGPGDHASLVAFSDAVTISGPGSDVAKAVRALGPHGRSNLEAGIDAAADLLRHSDNGLVVLMTDGQPTIGDPLETGSARSDFAGARVVVAHFNYPSRQAALTALFPSATLRYVPDGPAGEAAVVELARLAVAPVMEDLHLTIEGAGVAERAGTIPTRLAVGDFVRVMARVQGDAVVRVTGRIDDRPFSIEENVSVPADPDGQGDHGYPVEWARMRIHDLDDVLAGPGLTNETRIMAETEERTLGKQYGLVTKLTSFVTTDPARDDVTPEMIKPGDPEIRIHAPRSALGVHALLPWGESVQCSWQDDGEVWVGRFLVPRGTSDGSYAVRVFVDSQAGTRLRGTLTLRVDSRPPELELRTERIGDALHLEARLARKSDAGKDRSDVILPDADDIRHVMVQVGDVPVVLVRVPGRDLWAATVPLMLAPGTYTLRMTATDQATNTSETRVTLEVR